MCCVDPFSLPWCNLFTVPLDIAGDVEEKTKQAEVPICFCISSLFLRLYDVQTPLFSPSHRNAPSRTILPLFGLQVT